ncbi:hypothetical protein PMG11_09426 [Penicillium brasilianum]|uniref:Uncharacterized protein n=1 Tax=Penicillium brasilianum TaxID=104259 RepID=A0A0F7TY37_PENBI|nr:hypothetical protein PMG11_09426 [Penicillium brasilianum]
MPTRLRLQIRRLRTRMRNTYTTDRYYETYDYKPFPPRVQKCHRLRRTGCSRPGLHRRHTFSPSSNTSDTDPEDLYWIQSPRNRARTFTSHSGRPDFVTVGMDRPRSWNFWRSILGLEYFDAFLRRKRETRTRHEQECPIPRPRPRPRAPRDQYSYTRKRHSYTRTADLRYCDEPIWGGPSIHPPRRAPSPPRSPRRRSNSLRRRGPRSISPEPHVRRHLYGRPRRDVRRPPPPEPEPTRSIPRPRPTRPSSPITEREPPRPGRYTSPHPPVTIIQPSPRVVSPQGTRGNTPSHPTTRRPHDAETTTHNSFRERMNRKRVHSPGLTSLPRSRKVRFREGHEEIAGPVYFNSDSDSSSDSDSDSGGHPGPSQVNTRSRPRSRSGYGQVVVTQVVERRPRDSRGGGETADLRRGSLQERVGSGGVCYVVREPKNPERRRDYRRHN